MTEIRHCRKCGMDKPFVEFHKDPRKKNGVASNCRDCVLNYKKDRYTPERAREISLRSLYGITLEEYSILLEEQDYRCAICAEEHKEGGRPLFVDHAHKSKKVRGLLCIKCNFGIGSFEDNIQLLQNAIDYLR